MSKSGAFYMMQFEKTKPISGTFGRWAALRLNLLSYLIF